jgi:cysteine-rich repeat protein
MQCVAVAPVCGDGFVSAGEQCGEPGLASCAAGKECRNCYCVSPYCGDGFPDVNEECGEPGLSCSDGKQCQYCQCKTVTTTAVCGNGVIEGAEECDDGNKGGGDGCSSTCTQEEGWSCMNDQVPSFTPTGGASFKDAGIRDIGAAALDEHRVLIAQVESSRVGIVVADVQDAGVTYGEMKFTGSIPSSADFPTADAIALGGGKAVVAYSERGNNGANISNCNLVYVSTEGKTVTVGKSVRIPLESSSRFCNRLKVVALSPQQLIVSYTDQNDWYDATNAQEKLVAVSVAADGSLTVGPVALGESNMESWYLLKADAGRFLLADYPVALRGVPIKTPRVRLGKVQNNAISFLGGVDLPSQYVVGMNMLDATHVFIQTVRQTSGIQVFTTSDVPYTVVGTLSATGIALEKPLPWNPSVQRSPLVPIAPNVFLFSYLKYGGAAGNDASKVGGYVVVATRNSDGTLSFLEPMNFDPGHYLLADGRNRAVITPLTQRKFFIVYPVRTTQNFGNGNGRGIVGTLVPASRSICRSDSAICGNDKSEAGEECGEPGKSCQAGFGCLDCKCLPVGVACGNNRIDAGEVCGEPGLQQCVPGDMCNNCKCIIAHPFLCTDMCKEGASGPSACKHVCVGFDRNPDASLCPNEGYVNSFSCTVGKPPCSYGCIR